MSKNAVTDTLDFQEKMSKGELFSYTTVYKPGDFESGKAADRTGCGCGSAWEDNTFYFKNYRQCNGCYRKYNFRRKPLCAVKFAVF